MTLDPRLHAYRSDLADSSLEGQVGATRFVEPVAHQIIIPALDIRNEPDSDSVRQTQGIYGETFHVLEADDGWAWGQLETDGYVGYVDDSALAPRGGEQTTHRVIARATYAYGEPDIKTAQAMLLSFGAQFTSEEEGEKFLKSADGYVLTDHAARVSDVVPASPEAVMQTAMQFLDAPYLWGGRSSFGLDCSALMQFAFSAIGVQVPRDSDMQATHDDFAEPMQDFDLAKLKAGDLVFWKGHVGLMASATEMIHANGHHMQTVREPIAGAVERIESYYAKPIGFRRPKVFT